MKNIFYVLMGLLAFSCQLPERIDGPYFGNGIKNGWADQNSIVIWTRLTQNKEAFFEGRPFTEISKEQMLFLAKNPNVDSIYATQIPEGLSLEDMEGYCPGAAGEVQLHYYTKGNPKEAVVSDWVAVDENKDYTHQWKLEGLQAGKSYRLKVLSRQKGSDKVADSVFGSFLLPNEKTSVDAVKFCVVSCHDYNRRDDMKNGHKIYPSN